MKIRNQPFIHMRENITRTAQHSRVERPDNQQERPIIETIPADLGWYLAGFTDGEGSFNVSTVNRNKDFQTGWKIVLTFNISQRDHSVLHLFRETLGCGTLRDRGDGIGYYDVRRVDDLLKIVIPFFERFPLRSVSKKHQFEVFREIAQCVARGDHHTRQGMEKIFLLRQGVHVARRRKYTLEQILNTFHDRNPQRLYAEHQSSEL
jgi:hypothetical protein